MKTNVSFICAEEFVSFSDEDGILSVDGAAWFVAKLKKISDIEIDDTLRQEDWGVIVFAKRNRRKFWIGLSFYPEGENCWLAHIHHASFFQRFSGSAKSVFKELVRDLHAVLKTDLTVSRVRWITEADIQRGMETWNDSP